MKTPTILTSFVIATGSLAALSCSGQSETSAAQRSAEAPAEDPILPPGEVDIPTQEDADRAAEQAINDANADAELEKLEKEIEGGGG